MFSYGVQPWVVCRGPSLLQRYQYTEDRSTNLLASTIRTRKQQQQKIIKKIDAGHFVNDNISKAGMKIR